MQLVGSRLRSRLRALLFWKAWRCAGGLRQLKRASSIRRIKRDQLRAARAQFERDVAKSACRAVLRAVVVSYEGNQLRFGTNHSEETRQTTALMEHVFFTWKSTVQQNRQIQRLDFRSTGSILMMVGTGQGKEKEAPDRTFDSYRMISEGDRDGGVSSVSGSRQQPRRRLPSPARPIPLPASSSSSRAGNERNSYLLGSGGSKEEHPQLWRAPPRRLTVHDSEPLQIRVPAAIKWGSTQLPKRADFTGTSRRDLDSAVCATVEDDSAERILKRSPSHVHPDSDALRRELARDIMTLVQQLQLPAK